MKAKPSAAFAALYGSAGRLTVRRHQAQPDTLVLHERQNPAQPKTAAQLLVQARIADLYKAFDALNTSGRVQYILEAAKRACTPFNAFLKDNWLLPPATTGLGITQITNTTNATFTWDNPPGPAIPATDTLTLNAIITAHSATTGWQTTPSYMTPPTFTIGTTQPYPANLSNLPSDCDELEIMANWQTLDGLHQGPIATATTPFSQTQTLPAPASLSVSHN